MWVRLRFVGAYSLATGRRRDAVNVPRGTTIGGLLDRLAARYGGSFESMVRDREGGLAGSCRLFFDQEDVSRLGLDAQLREGSDVSVYFLMGASGG
ncbi:MAG: MoaD/ThiS family protein [Chloroflexi bacterium]|nr:MoaD/ThiS family protein [Chloroflexota bacterium]